MTRILIQRWRLVGGATVFAALAAVSFAAFSASAGGPGPGPAPFKVFAPAVSGESAVADTLSQLPGCEFVGTWASGEFFFNQKGIHIAFGAPLPPPYTSAGVAVTLPVASSDDFQIVLVNRASSRVLRTDVTGPGTSRAGLVSATSDDFIGDIDVYLCRRTRPGPATWGTTVEDLQPLTIHVTPPPGTWALGPVLIIDPGTFPGEEASFDVVVTNNRGAITGPFDIVTDLNFDTIPLVTFDSKPVADIRSGPIVAVLDNRSLINNRTAFDIEVVSPNALWNFNLNFTFNNSTLAGTFPAPVVIDAYEPWVGSLIFPNSVLAPGTTAANFFVNLTGGSSPAAAPNQALVIPGPITHAYTIGGGEDDWALYGFFYNPADDTVTFDNEQADVIDRYCSTNEVVGISRSPLSGPVLLGERVPETWDEFVEIVADRAGNPLVGPDPTEVSRYHQWWLFEAACYDAQNVAVR